MTGVQPGARERYRDGMTEEDREQQALGAQQETASDVPEEEDDDDVASPFDHPAFLPVLLWALSLWFGYDGWLNADFQEGGESHDSVNFNRYGFGLLILAAIYYTQDAVRKLRAEESAPTDETQSGGE